LTHQQDCIQFTWPDTEVRQHIPTADINRLVAAFNSRKARRKLPPLLATSFIFVLKGSISLARDLAVRHHGCGHGLRGGEAKKDLLQVKARLRLLEERQVIELADDYAVTLSHLPIGNITPSAINLPHGGGSAARELVLREHRDGVVKLATARAERIRDRVTYLEGEVSRGEERQRRSVAGDLGKVRRLSTDAAKLLAKVSEILLDDDLAEAEIREQGLATLRQLVAEGKEYERIRADILREEDRHPQRGPGGPWLIAPGGYGPGRGW
jgi:hypothetical protein